ncbi:hydantoinase B/oxoprolinase family protein [Roseivivax sediminis]|uniref:N-methylhydantoinase B n=1 Tax=Roseivivax sediminis TaxID=936889 RepID=A0A1I1V6I6_9RHOB|nr:hydantoinase B/oxoprolinase family protein [Roseivivax sediminis]SFD78534.1 N-methylhydantoinase B [Roseivivax sediminis]
MVLPAGSDAVTREIIEGKLLATVDEMGVVMGRTSMSPVIYEVLDFACGILTPEGELVAQMNGITLFTGTFGTQVQALIARFGEDVAPGDVLLTNDPFAGGTHACDLAIVRPVFLGGRLAAWAINVAHYLDVGGSVPGSVAPDATSVFEEGLRLPGVKIVRNDTLSAELVSIIRENVRLPDIAMGDLNAQLATVRIAERRLSEIVDKYGHDSLRDCFTHLLDTSEAEARAVIAALPDGTYRAQDVIDGDGVSPDQFEVCVAVTIAGDAIEADFTGCPPACAGPINCARGALNSAVKTIVKALVAPHAPSNDGWFRPLTVTAPDGTLFTAMKPAPTGWYYEGSVHASELVWKALAGLKPGRFSAGPYSSLCATYISGTDQAGRPFIHVEPQHGGWGATDEGDGASALMALTNGDTYNYSVEVIEAKFPLRVTRYGFNTEGGAGAGRHRGGYGLVRDYEVLAPGTVVHGSFGRSQTRPWGLDGGAPGSVNALIHVPAGGKPEHHSRIGHLATHPGDTVRIVTGGGGGWGPPEDRAPEDVAQDVRAGLLTEAEAREIYGHAGEDAA